MKTNYFYGSIAIRQCNGYTENLEFNVVEGKGLTFRYPYGDATPKEAEAIAKFVKTITDAYNVLSSQINMTNKTLKLEQYAPVVSSEKIASKSAVPQHSHGTCSNNLDCTDLVAHSEAEQERRDMEEEMSKGADGDIDKPKSTVSQSCALGGEEGLTVPEIVQYSLEATETESDKA